MRGITKTEVLHYPTLRTVLMVEAVLKNAKEPLTRYKIMQRLDKKVMLQTLDVIIDYMDKRGLVLDSKKGILWTYTTPDKMKKWLNDSVEV